MDWGRGASLRCTWTRGKWASSVLIAHVDQEMDGWEMAPAGRHLLAAAGTMAPWRMLAGVAGTALRCMNIDGDWCYTEGRTVRLTRCHTRREEVGGVTRRRRGGSSAPAASGQRLQRLRRVAFILPEAGRRCNPRRTVDDARGSPVTRGVVLGWWKPWRRQWRDDGATHEGVGPQRNGGKGSPGPRGRLIWVWCPRRAGGACRGRPWRRTGSGSMRG